MVSAQSIMLFINQPIDHSACEERPVLFVVSLMVSAHSQQLSTNHQLATPPCIAINTNRNEQTH